MIDCEEGLGYKRRPAYLLETFAREVLPLDRMARRSAR